jgi:LDH2 family malate/lactate/ureidoglycolate dehydrogenase
MMVEVLSSVLSGSAIGSSIGSMYKNLDRKQDVGHFFCLLDIDAFMDVAEFKQRIDEMIDRIKSCRRRPGVEEILVPGERSARTTRENTEHGIQLDPATLKELRQLCDDYKIDWPLAEHAAA